jgi:hypothetical protein
VLFLVFFALTIFATYEKNARILDPTSPIARHYAPAKWYLPVHGVFGILAMGLAAFQFSNRIRARHLRMHRLLGYAYVTSVFISAPQPTCAVAAQGIVDFAGRLASENASVGEISR